MARLILALFAAVLLGAPASGAEDTVDRTAEQPSEAWQEIRETLYPDLQIQDGAGMIALKTPYRAHDAAVVPVSIEIAPPFGRLVTRASLIIDENPAPVAAEFEFDEGLGRVIALSTRIRVDAYSNVRVVAELDDGSMYQFARFVKASGGCSAPALKDAEAALAAVGKMKVRLFEATESHVIDGRREAKVMVRHPNYSGFQINQITHLHIPAFFIDEMEVWQGDERLLRVTGGISLSEDPSLRFRYLPNGAGSLTLRAHDTDGNTFERAFPVDTAS